MIVVLLPHVRRHEPSSPCSRIPPGAKPIKVHKQRIAEARRERRWTQDELATAAGLNLRTVQRIEREGTGALQSIKGIAAALDEPFQELVVEENHVEQWEYKTVEVPYKGELFRLNVPDVEDPLNEHARDGWRLRETVTATTLEGAPRTLLLILERLAKRPN